MQPVEGTSSGFSVWLTTLSLSTGDWTTAYWRFGRDLSPDFLPDSVYRDQAERDVVQGMVAAALLPDADLPRLHARFREMGHTRRAEAPLRYFGWLPLRRGFGMWAHHEKTPGMAKQLFASLDPGMLVYSILVLPFVVLSLAGFLLSWPIGLRIRDPRWILAAVILLRTYSILFVGALAGLALTEVRYLAPVQPLAVMLALTFIPFVRRQPE